MFTFNERVAVSDSPGVGHCRWTILPEHSSREHDYGYIVINAFRESMALIIYAVGRRLRCRRIVN